MTVAEYIIDFLASKNIKHVFLMTGGAIAFVVDAFHDKKNISYVCFAHEQAAAMAADSYARMGPGIAATMVTSGPGATNLITGICCSWFDSIPTIHISGQVNTYEQKGNTNVRQIGFQETDIVSIAKPITKFSCMLDKPENIKHLLEKAFYIATTGRPGPVLIDIPQNFQRIEVDPNKMIGFISPKTKPYSDSGVILHKKVKQAIAMLKQAKRPVLLLGGGIRIAHAEKEMEKVIQLLQIPVVTTWSGFDLIPHNYPLRIGEIGVYGNRAANFTIQNADCVISVGARLDTRTTGGKPETFARAAKKIVVDIDIAELEKKRGLLIDLPIQSDAKEFLSMLSKETGYQKNSHVLSWYKKCIEWRKKYQTVKKQYYLEKKVNPYAFIETLSQTLPSDAIVIPDDGGHLTWTMQAFKLKKGQRLFSAYGNSPMGYAFPAAIGVAFAQKEREVICIDGDGSIQINIQELQTLSSHKLPVKIFVINNHGYGIIKQFQELYLDSRFEATGKGYSAPDLLKVAKAYKIKTARITSHKNMQKKIKQVLKTKGPVICEVVINDNQKLIPKLEFGKPIEDLSPLLPRDEFAANMIIDTYKVGEIKDAGV